MTIVTHLWMKEKPQKLRCYKTLAPMSVRLAKAEKQLLHRMNKGK